MAAVKRGEQGKNSILLQMFTVTNLSGKEVKMDEQGFVNAKVLNSLKDISDLFNNSALVSTKMKARCSNGDWLECVVMSEEDTLADQESDMAIVFVQEPKDYNAITFYYNGEDIGTMPKQDVSGGSSMQTGTVGDTLTAGGITATLSDVKVTGLLYTATLKVENRSGAALDLTNAQLLLGVYDSGVTKMLDGTLGALSESLEKTVAQGGTAEGTVMFQLNQDVAEGSVLKVIFVPYGNDDSNIIAMYWDLQ